MTVELAIITKTAPTAFAITRAYPACEFVATVDAARTQVRLLEAAAGYSIGDLVTVPNAKVRA